MILVLFLPQGPLPIGHPSRGQGSTGEINNSITEEKNCSPKVTQVFCRQVETFMFLFRRRCVAVAVLQPSKLLRHYHPSALGHQLE